MRELLAELTAALEGRRPCVYCAVVATRGSTPQKAGAAMLVYADGTQAGTLGGGCVEAEVKRRALHALNAGDRPAVLTFDLDGDYGWDDGLICGGRMTVLAHPLPADGPGRADAAGYYRRLHDLAAQGHGFTEAVTLADAAGRPAGDRYLFDADGVPVSHLAAEPAWDAVKLHLAPLSERPRPTAHQGVAYLPAPPRVTVFLVGGGHVGQAVARLAAEVDFDVWVLDDRDRYASRERFPAAGRLFVGDIGATLRELAPALTPAVYALVLTRGHSHDEEALYHLAGSACGFVGLIGSKRKNRLIFEDLAAKGVAPDVLARVHAPLGYDIGSRTVPEIAVSIVAELIAHRNLGTAEVARRTWVRRGASA
jgi:xanthine dehydrogenase accessory factor